MALFWGFLVIFKAFQGDLYWLTGTIVADSGTYWHIVWTSLAGMAHRQVGSHVAHTYVQLRAEGPCTDRRAGPTVQCAATYSC